ncbi:unnamed protein product [Arabis nemorensis]|uniref:Uncharacterized protein n=1 Tax=Arabis nemorensis TaxID=586526 RepID=A0A565BRE1_9BRAS|nr:unnamed protein product [Arabis nemorensis]
MASGETVICSALTSRSPPQHMLLHRHIRSSPPELQLIRRTNSAIHRQPWSLASFSGYDRPWYFTQSPTSSMERDEAYRPYLRWLSLGPAKSLQSLRPHREPPGTPEQRESQDPPEPPGLPDPPPRNERISGAYHRILPPQPAAVGIRLPSSRCYCHNARSPSSFRLIFSGVDDLLWGPICVPVPESEIDKGDGEISEAEFEVDGLFERDGPSNIQTDRWAWPKCFKVPCSVFLNVLWGKSSSTPQHITPSKLRLQKASTTRDARYLISTAMVTNLNGRLKLEVSESILGRPLPSSLNQMVNVSRLSISSVELPSCLLFNNRRASSRRVGLFRAYPSP